MRVVKLRNRLRRWDPRVLVARLNESEIKLAKAQEEAERLVIAAGAFPAGHYYSPLVNRETLADVADRSPSDLAGIDLNVRHQRGLLEEFSELYAEMPFPVDPTEGHRYYFSNDWFGYADAISLYSMLRHLQPARIVEVGSGYSSAVILDVVETFNLDVPEITFIEPYPDRLESLLNERDRDYCKILVEPIQTVPISLFASLESGDLLFVDSSHVSKFGSDLNRILFEILPVLAPGVIVHFHDIFYPFEYPYEWVRDGIFWNEAYMLRSFLMNNAAWEIYFFVSHMSHHEADLISARMPLIHQPSGGSLYLRKR